MRKHFRVINPDMNLKLNARIEVLIEENDKTVKWSIIAHPIPSDHPRRDFRRERIVFVFDEPLESITKSGSYGSHLRTALDSFIRITLCTSLANRDDHP